MEIRYTYRDVTIITYWKNKAKHESNNKTSLEKRLDPDNFAGKSFQPFNEVYTPIFN